jgi:hypothetical protein
MSIILNAPTNNGLVGYWKLDEGIGNIAHDFSGNKNHATLINIPQWTDGIFNSALSFNGKNQYALIGGNILNTSVDMAGKNECTISLWVYLNDISTQSKIFGIWDDNGGGAKCYEYLVYVDVGGVPAGAFWDSTNSPILPTGAAGAIKINCWYNIVITYKRNSISSIYINGSLMNSVATDDAAIFTPAQASLAIGTGFNVYPTVVHPTNGIIDEIRLYNRVLSQIEITNLYQAGSIKLSAAPNTGLIGYWPFDEGSGNVAYDFSGNKNNNGTLVGSPTYTDGIIGKALTFNGSSDYVTLKNTASINLGNGVTFSAWIKRNAASEPIISSYNGQIAPKGFGLWVGDLGGNEVDFFWGDGSTSYGRATDSDMIENNKWFHVVGVWDGSMNSCANFRIYVDGARRDTQDYLNVNPGAYSPTTQTLDIGHVQFFSSEAFFNGSIDDVRIYNRPLSQMEIINIYNFGKSRVGNKVILACDNANRPDAIFSNPWLLNADGFSQPGMTSGNKFYGNFGLFEGSNYLYTGVQPTDNQWVECDVTTDAGPILRGQSNGDGYFIYVNGGPASWVTTRINGGVETVLATPLSMDVHNFRLRYEARTFNDYVMLRFFKDNVQIGPDIIDADTNRITGGYFGMNLYGGPSVPMDNWAGGNLIY